MKVLSICHDAGGARAVFPVTNELSRQGITVQAVVAGPAESIWRKECPAVPAITVEDHLLLNEAESILLQGGVDVLLSASGLYNEVEHTFRQAARKAGVRSLAVLDSWLNYGERFERIANGRCVRCWPDRVCTLDRSSRDGLLKVGFSPEQVIITGPPHLEAIVRSSRLAHQHRTTYRAEQGFKAEDFLVVFFSDPFFRKPDGRPFEGVGGLMGPDGKSLLGYTSVDILEAVLAELEVACREAQRPGRFVVKPHPLEQEDALRPVIDRHQGQYFTASLRTEENPVYWIVAADAVMGMMSIALLEAALAGRPAISVEIGLKESGTDDPCASNGLGYTTPVYNRSDLASVARRLCQGEFRHPLPVGAAALKVEGAALRVAEQIKNLALVPKEGTRS